MSQVLNMRYLKELLKRIDEFKNKKRVLQLEPKLLFISFNTHSNSRTIEMAEAIPCPKAIHPLPNHWAVPFMFLEEWVFSPINDKKALSLDWGTPNTAKEPLRLFF